ncbi:glutamate receptor 2.9-like isoform X2 [Wolffia australiana]
MGDRRAVVVVVGLILFIFLRSTGDDSTWKSFGVFAAATAAEDIFRVGVILDLGMTIGKISRSCIAMAVEDFYAANPRYRTRIELIFRDAGSDPVTAASAALELVKEKEVHVILGPQRSIQAKFLIDLGNRTHVPIVAFSAKRPTLSPSISPYFLRAAMDDSTQAQAIADIVEHFRWREVIPIIEDSDYGNGMTPFLVDELQSRGAAVPYQILIHLNSSASAIAAELRHLRSNRTRVFIVHASHELGTMILSQAKAEGMMGDGFVWIVSYGLILSPGIGHGVIGLKPFFPQSLRRKDFVKRWARRFEEFGPGPALMDPTAFGLWAYDATWAVAIGAEKVKSRNLNFLPGDGDFGGLGRSAVGPELLQAISDVDFEGLTGRFHLAERQRESSILEIVNVVGDGLTRVGYWTRARGVNMDLRRPVVWPGGGWATPKGWEWPTEGRTLKLGVPVKPGFEQFVNVTWNPMTGSHEFSGFCIQAFLEVIKSLPYPVLYEFKAFDDGHGNNNGSYDDLVYQVFLQEFDGVVGDVTIVANRSQYVDFTLPFTDSGVTMVVPVREGQSRSWWVFTQPLSWDLWLASLCFVLFTGLVVWLLEHRVNDEFRGKPSNQAGTVFYFSFSTLVFAHREVVSNWARFVVVVWVFVVLILTSSYTASLTSMLTLQQLKPTMTDLGDLIKRNERVGYLNDSFLPGLLKQLKVDPMRIVAYSSPDEYAAAMDRGTENGGVGAIVDEIPYLKVFLNKYCGKYAMVGPTYKTNGFGFAFPKGSLILPDVSRAVLNFTESKVFEELERKAYGTKDCPAESFKMAPRSLELCNFGGLFLITGATSGGALLVFLVSLFLGNWSHVCSIFKTEASLPSKLLSLLKLFDQKEEEVSPREEMAVGAAAATSAASTVVAGDPGSGFPSQMQSPLSISSCAFEQGDAESIVDNPPLEDNEAPDQGVVDRGSV